MLHTFFVPLLVLALPFLLASCSERFEPTGSTIPETRQVCLNLPAGYAPVRYGPHTNSAERGYVAAGETIQLSDLDETWNIQEDGRGNFWLRIEIPISGWVNARFICKEEAALGVWI